MKSRSASPEPTARARFSAGKLVVIRGPSPEQVDEARLITGRLVMVLISDDVEERGTGSLL